MSNKTVCRSPNPPSATDPLPPTRTFSNFLAESIFEADPWLSSGLDLNTFHNPASSPHFFVTASMSSWREGRRGTEGRKKKSLLRGGDCKEDSRGREVVVGPKGGERKEDVCGRMR